MSQVHQFHDKWFKLQDKSFMYSKPRFLHYFYHDTTHILFFCYIIWAYCLIDCPTLTVENHEKANSIYEKACLLGQKYWDENRSNENFNTSYYLSFLLQKSDFEYLTCREHLSSASLSWAARFSQLASLDRMDTANGSLLPISTCERSRFFGTDCSTTPANFFHFQRIVAREDDGFDENMPLVEEVRRAFWNVYVHDRWMSISSGWPALICQDTNTLLYTLLPSPTTFLSLDEVQSSTMNIENNGSEQSCYLHTAMSKLNDNELMLDFHSVSSEILLLTVSENITKWSRNFLCGFPMENLDSTQGLVEMGATIETLVKHFKHLQNNLLRFDLSMDPMLQVVVDNSTTIIYHSVLTKLTCLMEKKLASATKSQHVSPIEIIGFEQYLFFKDLLFKVTKLATGLSAKFRSSGIKLVSMICKLHMNVLFMNSVVKSLLQSFAFFQRFKNVLELENEEDGFMMNKLATEISVLTQTMKSYTSQCKSLNLERILRFFSLWVNKIETAPANSFSLFNTDIMSHPA
ncbi:unnamed protein product [Ambrosiozyma monospora]|uniref:Unnamed protein product n=1 Tax=Ambrosiozyma monospora TaxID=43982 RepID=A0ACB5TAB2_AMBMO|nr:unnamed protein product [Ambrosiozyma monospora]